jgi:hypothetical protein
VPGCRRINKIILCAIAFRAACFDPWEMLPHPARAYHGIATVMGEFDQKCDFISCPASNRDESIIFRVTFLTACSSDRLKAQGNVWRMDCYQECGYHTGVVLDSARVNKDGWSNRHVLMRLAGLDAMRPSDEYLRDENHAKLSPTKPKHVGRYTFVTCSTQFPIILPTNPQ